MFDHGKPRSNNLNRPARSPRTSRGMHKKIPIKRCTDDKIVKTCQKKTGQNCYPPAWADYEDAEIETSEDAIALVVDISTSQGHVRIFDANGVYIDMVGQDYRGHSVVVMLEAGCQYTCFGQCRIATVRREST
ncbi:hypothetical protein BJ170DRAFT_606340 [Xylariales sp. AK1849]|nr:hypothetical protein BJ170DRAFT_606340 [Xylariales sp. AK1849]